MLFFQKFRVLLFVSSRILIPNNIVKYFIQVCALHERKKKMYFILFYTGSISFRFFFLFSDTAKLNWEKPPRTRQLFINGKNLVLHVTVFRLTLSLSVSKEKKLQLIPKSFYFYKFNIRIDFDFGTLLVRNTRISRRKIPLVTFSA